MASLRLVYTQHDLLRLAPLVAKIPLSEEIIKKFDCIEVVDTVPGSLRRGPERHANAAEAPSVNLDGASANNVTIVASSSGNSGTGRGRNGGGGGGNERRGTNVHEEPRRMHDRFAPPPRGWRSNRDQETFEEGIKYEQERNAAHMKHLQETIAKEEGKEFKATEQQMVQKKAQEEEKGSDEIERLLAGITMGEDTKANNARRSRFFNTGANNNATINNNANSIQAAFNKRATCWENGPDGAIWGQPLNASTLLNHSSVNMTAAHHTPSAGGNDLGGVTISKSVANMPGTQALNTSATSSKSQATRSSMVPPNHMGVQEGSTAHVVRAEDLERMLQAGKMPSTGSISAASVPLFPPTQDNPKAVIQASELESLLLRQARGFNQSTPTGSAQPTPAAMSTSSAAIQHLQTSTAPRTMPQMPKMLHNQPPSMGGMNMPSQQWMHAPAPQSHQSAKGLMPQPAPPTLSTGKLPIQQPMSGPNGMPVPLLMNPQGQFFASTQPQYFVPGGQQSPVMYRRADGTVYMPPPSSNLNPFPTSAQYLYQQQQRR